MATWRCATKKPDAHIDCICKYYSDVTKLSIIILNFSAWFTEAYSRILISNCSSSENATCICCLTLKNKMYSKFVNRIPQCSTLIVNGITVNDQIYSAEVKDHAKGRNVARETFCSRKPSNIWCRGSFRGTPNVLAEGSKISLDLHQIESWDHHMDLQRRCMYFEALLRKWVAYLKNTYLIRKVGNTNIRIGDYGFSDFGKRNIRIAIWIISIRINSVSAQPPPPFNCPNCIWFGAYAHIALPWLYDQLYWF